VEDWAVSDIDDGLSLWRLTQTVAYKNAQADEQVGILRAALGVSAAQAAAEERERCREALALAADVNNALAKMYDGQDAERKESGEIGSQHRDRFEAFLDSVVDAARDALRNPT
jgi:hypothetical protein